MMTPQIITFYIEIATWYLGQKNRPLACALLISLPFPQLLSMPHLCLSSDMTSRRAFLSSLTPMVAE